MTPRQARLAVDIFTGAVIASVAIALATLTWRLTGESGIGPAAAPVGSGEAVATDIRPLIALAPFGTPIATTGVVADNGAIRLKGIFLASPIEASVVLLATADGKVASYTIGAPVGGGVIERIEAEQITLRTPTGMQVVGFNPQNTMTAASRPNGAVDPGAVAAAAIGAAAAVAEQNGGSGLAGATPQAARPANQTSPRPISGAEAVRAMIPQSVQGRAPPPQPSPSTTSTR